MKKFKGLFKKHMAVLLAVVLVAGILLPVLPTLVKAGASEAEDIAELQTAWTNMTEKEFVALDKWAKYYAGSDTYTENTTTATDYVAAGGSVDGITADRLGSYVGAFNVDSAATSQVVLSGKTGLTNAPNPYGDTQTKVYGYKEAYVYYKVNSVEAEGDLGTQMYVNCNLLGTGTNNYSPSAVEKISVTADDVNSGWQRIDLQHFFNGNGINYNWKTQFTSSDFIRELIFKAENGLKANITFGSLVAEKSVALPTNTTGWGINEWLAAADELDVSNYNGGEEFKTLVSELLVKYPEAAVSMLKSAWGGMMKKEAISLDKWAKYYAGSDTYAENSNTAADYIAAGGSIDGITVDKLGSYVGTFAVDSTAASQVVLSGKHGLTVAPNPYSDSITKLYGYEEAYVYYKVNSVESAGELGMQMYVNCNLLGSGANNYAPSSLNKISVTEADIAKGWQRVELQKFFNGNGINFDWKTQFTNSDFIRELIFKAENGLKANITFGSLVALKAADIPSASETASWNIEDWIIAADAVDTDDYLNTEKFTEILNELKAMYPNTALRLLKNAWSQMIDTNAYDLGKKPTYYEDDAKYTSTTSASMYLKNGGSIAGIKLTDLGSVVGTYDFDATGSTAGKLHLSKYPGTGDMVDQWADSHLSVYGYEEVYVYYKVNSVEQEGKLGMTSLFNSTFSNKTNPTNAAPTSRIQLSVTAEDVNKGWQKVNLQDFFEHDTYIYDWKTEFKDNHYILRLNFTANDNLKANITFGSLVGLKRVALPENTGSWDIGDWIIAADKLDISNYANTEKFTDTLNALKSQFSETLALANLKSAWKDLITSRSTVLRPTHYYDSNIKNSIIKTTSTAESGVTGIGAALLGSVTTTYDMVGLDDSLPTNKYDSSVVLSNINVWVDDPYSNTTERQVTIDTYDDLYVYFKVNSIKNEGKLAPVTLWQHKGRQTNSANYIDITAEDIGVWQKISIAEMTTGTACADWKSVATGAHLQNVQLCAVEGLEANITFGSLVGELKSEFENTAGYNLADWVYAALQVNTNNYSDNAAINDFNSALGTAKNLCDSLGVKRSGEKVSYQNVGDVTISSFGNNVLNKIEPTVTYFDGSVASELDEYKLFDWNRLADGTLDLDATAEKVTFANENSYFELVYDLQGKGNIKNILIAHTNNVALRNAKYKISLATDFEDLFSTETVLADYDNSVGDFAQSFTCGAGPAYQGRYLGIRIYVPATDMTAYDNVVRLTEIGAYGSVSKYSSVYTGQISNDEVAKLGKNLLTNEGMVLYVKNKDADPKGSWKYTKPTAIPGNLYNGDVNESIELYDTPDTTCVYSPDDSISQWLMFDLRASYDISNVLICSTPEGGYWALGRYEIYASNNINELTKPTSLVFAYDNRDTGPNQHAPGQLFTMEKGAMAARYVAVRITHPVSTFNSNFASPTRNEKNMNYARVSEFGFYGELYEKPLRRTNLSAHVPTKIYRTDENGVHTEIGADEYKATEQKLLYDGRYNVAVPVARNGKTLDYVLNLSQNARLLEVKLSTLTANMKGVKIYAALTEEDVWKETALAGTYNGNATAEISKLYMDSPLLARYLRISVQDTVNDTFDVTEIETIGWNTQEFDYVNLVGDRPELMRVMLEDKTDWDLKYYNESLLKYYADYPIMNALDSDEESIADIYAGKNGKETINILFDLEVNDVVDGFSFKAASERAYWPEKVNFYLSENEDDIFGENAKPVKSFTEKLDESTDGVYSFDVMPQLARYVRIEVDETHHPYYDDDDTILAVFDSIKVNGYTVVGVVDENGAIASFTDKATGIRADIMANSENDLFNVVKRMEVTRITPSEANIESMKNSGMKFVSDLFEITFYDSSDNVVTDIGGRLVKIYIPKKLSSESEDVWVINADVLGDFTIGSEQSYDADYYITTAEDISLLQYALGVFASDDTENDNQSSSTSKEDSSEGESPDEQDEPEEETKKRRKKVKVIKTLEGGIAWWIYVIIGASALVVIGGVLWYFLYFRKKRKVNKGLEG